MSALPSPSTSATVHVSQSASAVRQKLRRRRKATAVQAPLLQTIVDGDLLEAEDDDEIEPLRTLDGRHRGAGVKLAVAMAVEDRYLIPRAADGDDIYRRAGVEKADRDVLRIAGAGDRPFLADLAFRIQQRRDDRVVKGVAADEIQDPIAVQVDQLENSVPRRNGDAETRFGRRRPARFEIRADRGGRGVGVTKVRQAIVVEVGDREIPGRAVSRYALGQLQELLPLPTEKQSQALGTLIGGDDVDVAVLVEVLGDQEDRLVAGASELTVRFERAVTRAEVDPQE